MKKIGFIGGKFLPFHKGHESAILFASEKVEKLYVILSSSPKRDKELCAEAHIPYLSDELRMSWLGYTFAKYPNIHIINVVDADGAEDYNWSKGAELIKRQIGEKIDIVFSSEHAYDVYFTKNFPEAEHWVIDAERIKVPISATRIRKNIYKYWDFLPTIVQAHFAIKVAVVGTESCVDAKTEYFDGISWRKITDYNGGKVLQYNADASAKLVTPTRYINAPLGEEKFYKIQNSYGTWSQVYTQNHDLVYTTSKGNLGKKKMIDVYNAHYNNASGFQGDFISAFTYGSLNLPSESYIRLALAISADGSKARNKWRIKLKKERKIKRLRALILNAGYDLDERVYANGNSNFYLPLEAGFKVIPDAWLNFSQQLKDVIIDEIFNWDGCDKRYFSTIRENAEKVQFIFNSAGYKTLWYTDSRPDGDGNRSDCYSITLSPVKYTSIGINKNNEQYRDKMIAEYTEHNGKKYCFTVPSGMLVLRRDNHIFITGNCGKSTLCEKLANVYGCPWVPEVGRKITEDYGNCFTAPTFDVIAMKQFIADEEARLKASPFVFIDSEAVVTQYYLKAYMGIESAFIEAMIARQNIDMYIYLEPDIPWVADGYRFLGKQAVRDANNIELKQMFADRGLEIITICGNFEERLEKACDVLDNYLK